MFIYIYIYVCHCFTPDRTWHQVNDRKVDYSRGLGGGWSGTSWGSNPDGLYWSLTRLVQWWPDELNWPWIQIWVQARMPDYSLNWTSRFSAIQRGQRVSYCLSPTRRWPNRSRVQDMLKSSLDDVRPAFDFFIYEIQEHRNEYFAMESMLSYKLHEYLWLAN